MPMTRVSDQVLHSADQLRGRLQSITGERTWRGLTRDVQFAVALRAAQDSTDVQLRVYLAQLLETETPDDTA
jgi:hypothetical protein